MPAGKSVGKPRHDFAVLDFALYLDRAVGLYRPEEHRELAFRFGADIGITAQCVRAWALWLRGYPDQARRAFDEGLQRAQRSVHRHTLAYALIYKRQRPRAGRPRCRRQQMSWFRTRASTGLRCFWAMAYSCKLEP